MSAALTSRALCRGSAVALASARLGLGASRAPACFFRAASSSTPGRPGCPPASEPARSAAPPASSRASTRLYSNTPESSVYGGPSAPSPKRVTLRTLRAKHRRGEKLTMVTAYDYPSAVHVDQAGMDLVLVGDSAAMVVHGHDTTLPLTLEEMLSHCRAVTRGARRPFVVGDLPFGSFETSHEQAVATSVRMLKEGGVDAVKIEGGFPARVETVARVVAAGVAVMGHVGLTPQSVSALGGFGPTGRTAEAARRVVEEAKELERAGAFAIVLECLPAPVAAAVTAELAVPTIGIGAGPHVSGQVLVYHDLLGMMQHPHHAKVTPKFCKRYAELGTLANAALEAFAKDVADGTFPGQAFSPYKLVEGADEQLKAALRESGLDKGLQALEEALGEKEGAK